MTPLLTTQAAAELLCLDPGTLAQLRVKGTGPRFVKMGQAVRYRVEDLQAWLATKVVSSTSEQSLRRAKAQIESRVE